jgi:transcriptional regulator with XRE-family HTH domain
MKLNTIQTIGDILRQLRGNKKLPLKKVAALLDIDTSYYSKIERNEKKATKMQIQQLEIFFELDKNALMIPFLTEKVFYEIVEEDCAVEVLKIAEEEIIYIKTQKNGL